MAHLHFKRTVYKSGGGKATDRVAYITREPVKDLDHAAQQLRYIGHSQDATLTREDLVYTNARNLPEWAQDKAHTYFEAAERYEGVNRIAFEEWKITLPVELTRRQNMALMRDIVDAVAGNTLPIAYAFHEPQTLDKRQTQPHLHLLISSRQQDSYSRTPWQHFRRYNRIHPERGGAEKSEAFWHCGAVKAHRILLSDLINIHLEQAGQETRVHPDTLLARGINRTPEPKLWPSESHDYRTQGIIRKGMQAVLKSRTARSSAAAQEAYRIRQYWDARKQALGLTTKTPHAVKLQAIQTERQQRITQAVPLTRGRPWKDRHPQHPSLRQQWQRVFGNAKDENQRGSGHRLAPNLHESQEHSYE